METIGYSESRAKREIYIFNSYIKNWERSQINKPLYLEKQQLKEYIKSKAIRGRK